MKIKFNKYTQIKQNTSKAVFDLAEMPYAEFISAMKTVQNPTVFMKTQK